MSKPLRHPQEIRLQKAEREIADTIDELCAKTTAALRAHQREEAIVLLMQLEVTVDMTRRATAKALDDIALAARKP